MNKQVVIFICCGILASVPIILTKVISNTHQDAYVRSTMLLPDSEGRGFSDLVKEKIDREVPLAGLASQAYKVAQVKRDIVLSRNEQEFIEANKKSILVHNCIYHLFSGQKFSKSEFAAGLDKLVFDNEEMLVYYESLYTDRFNKVLITPFAWVKDTSALVETDEDYNQKCTKT